VQKKVKKKIEASYKPAEVEDSFFSKIFKSDIKPKGKYRKKEEKDFGNMQWGISDLVVEKGMEKVNKTPAA
jgi:hypothetical protein|tara:strand:- start:3290 stop:3502 length:213 start_codon:yes stop_codon:yes gene_type:complete